MYDLRQLMYGIMIGDKGSWQLALELAGMLWAVAERYGCILGEQARMLVEYKNGVERNSTKEHVCWCSIHMRAKRIKSYHSRKIDEEKAG